MLKEPLFKALNIKSNSDVKDLARKLKISTKTLRYYAESNIFPNEKDAIKICEYLDIDLIELKIKLGIIEYDLLKVLMKNSKKIRSLITKKESLSSASTKENLELVFTTKYGKMYQGDCIAMMKEIESD